MMSLHRWDEIQEEAEPFRIYRKSFEVCFGLMGLDPCITVQSFSKGLLWRIWQQPGLCYNQAP